MLTSEMVQLEIENDAVENQTNTHAPKENVYIISEWYNSDLIEYRPKSPLFIPNIVPDIISYYAPDNSLYRCKRLKYINKMQ